MDNRSKPANRDKRSDKRVMIEEVKAAIACCHPLRPILAWRHLRRHKPAALGRTQPAQLDLRIHADLRRSHGPRS